MSDCTPTPWYVLGLSNASGMFDIAGTMWMVYTLYVYGLKSIWLPWLWPVFNQIFLAAYLSQWLRRSGGVHCNLKLVSNQLMYLKSHGFNACHYEVRSQINQITHHYIKGL